MKMLSPEAYLTVASIFSGFGVTVLMFRLQREISIMEDPDRQDEPTWLAWADYLILIVVALSLLLVVLPIMLSDSANVVVHQLAAATCSACAILVAAYPWAILAHYRILFGSSRSGKRERGEPAERLVVLVSGILATGIFAAYL